MAYADQATLAQDSAFRARVRVAIVTAAVDVKGEAKGSLTNEVFGKRQDLAFRVLRQSEGWVEAFTWAVVANAAISGSSSDGDVQFTVNSVWNDVAGVSALD